MKRMILLAAAVLALLPWTLAQTTNSNGPQYNTSDNASITAGPTVTTTNNSATIHWATSGSAANLVMYGTDPNNLSQKATENGGGTNHAVDISNLQPGTTYYYAIMTNNHQTRERGQFTTKGGSSNNATSTENEAAENNGMTNGSENVHITMGPEIRNFNGSTATLYWETDRVGANDVRYGMSPNNLDQRAFERAGSRQHTAELNNLQPGQTYYFEIQRRNGTARDTGSFMLPQSATAQGAPGSFGAIPVQMSNGQTVMGNNQTYPYGNYPQQGANTNGAVQIISGPTVQSVSDTQAVISWTTNVPSSSTVRYGNSWLALNQAAQAQWGPNHTVTVSGLRPNTKYFFRVESAQAQGTGSATLSNFSSFQTGSPGQAAQAPR
jgi:phosphodiesterase/alkaline phosphatase D-like protein